MEPPENHHSAAFPLLPTPSTYVYARVDGRDLELDLHEPPQDIPSSARSSSPLVVWLHGGGWQGGHRAPLDRLPRALVDAGFPVASISYRLTSQRGAWGRAEVTFPAQIRDARAAVEWLDASLARLDLEGRPIVVAGESAGGHLAALLATSGDRDEFAPDADPWLRRADVAPAGSDPAATGAGSAGGAGGARSTGSVRSAGGAGRDDGPSDGRKVPAAMAPSTTRSIAGLVDIYGPSDLLAMDGDHDRSLGPPALLHDAPDSPESRLVGRPLEELREPADGDARARRRWLELANPIAHVTAEVPPALLAHGMADRVVPIAQSRRLAAALHAHGVRCELLEVPGRDHEWLGDILVDAVVRFLRSLDRAPRTRSGTSR